MPLFPCLLVFDTLPTDPNALVEDFKFRSVFTDFLDCSAHDLGLIALTDMGLAVETDVIASMIAFSTSHD